jgi:hypothetical protein
MLCYDSTNRGPGLPTPWSQNLYVCSIVETETIDAIRVFFDSELVSIGIRRSQHMDMFGGFDNYFHVELEV